MTRDLHVKSFRRGKSSVTAKSLNEMQGTAISDISGIQGLKVNQFGKRMTIEQRTFNHRPNGESQRRFKVLIFNNSGEEIPSNSFGKIDTSIDDDLTLSIIQPDADNIQPHLLVITDDEIIPDQEYGSAWTPECGAQIVAFNGTQPVVNDSFGTVADQWFGEKDKKGFRVLSATTGGVALINPFKELLTATQFDIYAKTSGGVKTEFLDFGSMVAADNELGGSDKSYVASCIFGLDSSGNTTPVLPGTSFTVLGNPGTPAGSPDSVVDVAVPILARLDDDGGSSGLSSFIDVFLITETYDPTALDFDSFLALSKQSLASQLVIANESFGTTPPDLLAFWTGGFYQENTTYDGTLPVFGIRFDVGVSSIPRIGRGWIQMSDIHILIT